VNRKRLGFILMGVGIALAIAVGAVVFMQVSAANQAISQLPRRNAVVATEDIPAGSQIKATQVALIPMPDLAFPANAATLIDETVVGKYTPTLIPRGQVVIATQIGDEATKGVPSYSLRNGQVLYAMESRLPNQQPLALTAVNALRSGDRVDFVYSTLVVPPEVAEDPDAQTILRSPVAAQYLTTRILLQNIRIDRLGTYLKDGTFEENPTYMIFVVRPEEALVLKWMRDAAVYFGNTIELILRAPGDQEPITTNIEINARVMRERYGLPEPPQVVVPQG
jgi:Flp pilus assembly protein CpaB